MQRVKEERGSDVDRELALPAADIAAAFGAIAAALAVFAPPYLIVRVGAPYYRRFAQNR